MRFRKRLLIISTKKRVLKVMEKQARY